MSKILEVKSCAECPINRNCTLWRGYLRGHINDNGLFLKGCPLPDSNGEKLYTEKDIEDIHEMAKIEIKLAKKRVLDEVIEIIKDIDPYQESIITYNFLDELKQKYRGNQ